MRLVTCMLYASPKNNLKFNQIGTKCDSFLLCTRSSYVFSCIHFLLANRITLQIASLTEGWALLTNLKLECTYDCWMVNINKFSLPQSDTKWCCVIKKSMQLKHQKNIHICLYILWYYKMSFAVVLVFTLLSA